MSDCYVVCESSVVIKDYGFYFVCFILRHNLVLLLVLRGGLVFVLFLGWFLFLVRILLTRLMLPICIRSILRLILLLLLGGLRADEG